FSVEGAMVRAQVQQWPTLKTTEGTSISILCSHPKIQGTDFIQWYRQFSGREPELLVSTLKELEELPDIGGQLSVSGDQRRSWLWLGRPWRGDAAVYYCALGP
ncbi:TVAZ2 protein, partial [Zosterops hypoxanthus]|nr:TVAZ2 protein [Zosterops hypoxanthus]